MDNVQIRLAYLLYLKFSHHIYEMIANLISCVYVCSRKLYFIPFFIQFEIFAYFLVILFYSDAQEEGSS